MAEIELTVEPDVCEANAMCVNVAPDLFDLDDDDRLHVLVAHPAGASLERARQAVDVCPKQALALKDAVGNDQHEL